MIEEGIPFSGIPRYSLLSLLLETHVKRVARSSIYTSFYVEDNLSIYINKFDLLRK